MWLSLLSSLYSSLGKLNIFHYWATKTIMMPWKMKRLVKSVEKKGEDKRWPWLALTLSPDVFFLVP